MGKVGMALDATVLEDSKRVYALHAYEILDTLPEPAFDRLAKLAAQICGTPYARGPGCLRERSPAGASGRRAGQRARGLRNRR